MIDKNVYFVEERAGFGELAKQSLEFGEYLKEKNIDEIIVYLSSTFDFCVALLGAMSAGVKMFIVPRVKDEISNITDKNFAQLRAKSSKTELVIDYEYEFYIYTSGSSGDSKAIKKSMKAMFDEAIFLNDFLKIHGKNIITSVSHQHMFGLTFKVFFALASGAKIHSSEVNYPEIIIIQDLKDAVFITSPVVLKALVKSGNLTSLTPLNLIITAGSKLEDEIREEFKSIATIMEIYGSTETGIVARNFGDGFEVFDEVDVSFDDEKKLIINSKWCDNFYSQDIGEINQNRLNLLGRFDRIVKINDIRFNLDEAEDCIKKHEFIDDAKCAILAQEKRISALVVLSDSGKVKFRNEGKKGIIKALKENLKKEFKTNIRKFKIIHKIGRNQNGKFGISDFEKAFTQVKKPKFSLIKKGENFMKFSTFLDEELFFYEGHFSDFPLTPGFVQLGFVFECMKNENIEIRPYLLENIKFTNFLRPFDTAVVEIKFEEKRVKFSIFTDEKICSSGGIRFE